MKKALLAVLACAIVFVSCSKKKDEIPTPVTPVVVVKKDTVVHKFMASATNPYSGTVTSGSLTYMLLRSPINDNNKFDYYPVYTSTGINGGDEYSVDTRNIWYNPTTAKDSLKFGSKVAINIAEFRIEVTNNIKKYGYAMISTNYSTQANGDNTGAYYQTNQLYDKWTF